MKKNSLFKTEDGRLYLHWLFFPCYLIYLDMLMPLFSRTPNKSPGITIILDIATGLLISIIISFFGEKAGHIITLVIAWLLAGYFSMQFILHGQFAVYMDFETIFAGTGNVVEGYGPMVIKAILGGIPGMVVLSAPAILYTIFGRKLLPAKRPSAWWILFLAGGAALFILASLFIINSSPNQHIYRRSYKFDSATRVFGLPTATRLELEYKLFGNSSAENFSGTEVIEEYLEEESSSDISPEKGTERNEMALVLSEETREDPAVAELDRYVKAWKSSSKNEYTGLFKGKNLILICAEAFSYAAIDPELTPTLYRLTHNGFYFSDYYQPLWGGSTSTGEFSFLMGLAPQFTLDSIQMTTGTDNRFTIGNQLMKEGYYNLAFHNGNYYYFSRNLTHKNLGYSEYIAYGSGLEDILEPDAGDAEMFDATMDLYIDRQPFCIYYMTISGHYPYVKDSPYTEKYYDRVNDLYGDKYEETTKYYIAYQLELEEALTVMVKKLEDAGIADDTVICMTADHYPYGLGLHDPELDIEEIEFGNDVDYLKDLYKGDDGLLWDRDRNALILWSGCLEGELKDKAVEVSDPVFSLDILPTLSNLFGVEFDSRLLVGRDVFSDEIPLVFWNEGSWITRRGRYDILTDEFFPAEGESRDGEYIEIINDMVADKKYFSGQVQMTDYYRILFSLE